MLTNQGFSDIKIAWEIT